VGVNFILLIILCNWIRFKFTF